MVILETIHGWKAYYVHFQKKFRSIFSHDPDDPFQGHLRLIFSQNVNDSLHIEDMT